MKEIISCISIICQAFLYGLTLYYLIISFFGLYRVKEVKNYSKPKNKFALIIAAHNEELVIGNIVESLKSVDYPDELYDVFVIADNCSDGTIEAASAKGAIVFERLDNRNKGKGYALDWMFHKLSSIDKQYNAVVIFDADNLASKNFLREMDQKLKEGYKVIQGYLDSKNPHDSWITECYSVAFWTSNRLFQLGRSNLGLSNQIGGTGFCVEINLLDKIGWGATCLTEDLEFTCKLVLNGYKVGWCHDAIIYDEKPLTLKQSWKQRKRWMQGFTDVSFRFFIKLLKKSILTRDFIALDCALYTLQPFIIVGLGIMGIMSFVNGYIPINLNVFYIKNLLNPIILKSFGIFQFLFTPFILLVENKLSKKLLGYMFFYSLNIFIVDKGMIFGALLQISFIGLFSIIIFCKEGKQCFKIFLWYLLYSIYILTWIPITVQGILNMNNKEWISTKHTRQISINEIEGVDGQSAA
jgi:cellulose synthase/poly-beta-1,6-N-acetylglucosamine synthase-like glycosyltransferase